MSGVMPQIKHVIYYMLENRSFDNILGWLYDSKNLPTRIIAGPDQQDQPFHGLASGNYGNSFDGESTVHPVERGVSGPSVPSPDPHEPFDHVTQQLFGSQWAGKEPPSGTPATMGGFLQDYSTAHSGVLGPLADETDWLGKLFAHIEPEIGPEKALQIMQSHTPDQLPVINGLGRAFAVSDLWFSSVPTQTMANRAFSVCGTSLGLVNNAGFLFGLVPDKYQTESIWSVLANNGLASTKDWMVYYQDKEMFEFCLTESAFNIPDSKDHVKPIDNLFDAIKSGTLPSFSYVEPAWYRYNLFSNGTDYHPPADAIPGEVFLKELYEALTANPQMWQDTLLIISFDEHGGTYDHVSPPWGATPPWGETVPAGMTLECGFQFDRFGVRIPTLFVSPYIDAGTVIRSPGPVPFDHTSMIATVLTWMGVPRSAWGPLGQRVANAPTFEQVLTRTTPRGDIPKVNLSAEAQAALDNPPAAHETAITPMQLKILPLLLQHIHGRKLNELETGLAMLRVLSGGHDVASLMAKLGEEAANAKTAQLAESTV